MHVSFREILLTLCRIAYFDSPTATTRSCDVLCLYILMSTHPSSAQLRQTHSWHVSELAERAFFFFVLFSVTSHTAAIQNNKSSTLHEVEGQGPLVLLWAYYEHIALCWVRQTNKTKCYFLPVLLLEPWILWYLSAWKKKKIPYPLRSSWTALLTGQLFLSTVTAMTEFFRGWRGPNRWTLPTCCVAGSVVFVGQQNTWWLSATF